MGRVSSHSLVEAKVFQPVQGTPCMEIWEAVHEAIWVNLFVRYGENGEVKTADK